MTSQNLLELTDLEVVVGRGTSEENKILGKLSLKIKPGDFICLLGGNGADKSTLLNVLAGAIQPTSGKILHAGKDISKESEVKRSSYIARVWQKRGLKLRRLKENIPAFKEALEKVNPDLAGKLDLPVDQLSGGQRQALSFVMATYNKPELLLLDEHIAALDPRYSRKLMEATDEQIRDKKITAVMITHHMEDALKYGNRLLVLDHGQISHDYQGQAKQDLTLQDLAALFD
ncbi:ABC transporter ATP-binding protein [Lactobacillus delbrueckii]|uniref:ABC transporter ATP-binding protein n=1 Tax=Lactobacillus delbrueckii TaxID=1584 RepID=UPI0000E5557D|nr:ATP-binding cassette domain-containing protein [Lactobacillus delbrueckii]ABJ58198.1 ABC-type uncharacterized transport system, ATPase component [Lactobacillus delbrueckii subsp. bulgaricus ATCC BAA-365]MBT8937594.1 ABC transporter ATP-binding protein [Lactobacillus delbrueckii subsp. bulgaricus]